MYLTYMNNTGINTKDSNRIGNLVRFVEPCILLLLRNGSAHGYHLIEDLEKHCGEKIDIGNLYRTLRKLEKNELVISSWGKNSSGPDRRAYTITNKGRQYLQLATVSLTKTDNLIHQFLEVYQQS